MKKLLILGVLAAGAAFFLLKKDENEPADSVTEAKRQLTDAEALKYLQDNSDVAQAFGANNIEKAKFHWFNFGFDEGRPAPYFS